MRIVRSVVSGGQALRRVVLTRLGSSDSGMSTAEYAVGTVAACGFGAALYKVVTSPAVASALNGLIQRALNSAF